MKKIALYWQILIALTLALVIGLTLRKLGSQASDDEFISQFANYAQDIARFLGKLFMSSLKMVIVPLIFSAVVAGIAGLTGLDRLKQQGLKIVGFYGLSTLVATLIGLVLVNTIQPGLVDGEPNVLIKEAFSLASADRGSGDFVEGGKFSDGTVEGAKNWKSLFFRMFPPNIIQAATDNGQLLGILVFALLFGIAITQFPREQMTTIREFAEGFNAVMIKITQWIMAVSPIGLFGLMLATVMEVGGGFIWEMKSYMATVLLALGTHLFIALPIILIVIGKVNPIRHFVAMKTALLTAFATASSAATLPVSMRCVQDNAGVSKKTASFAMPLGSTVNMDGTALYECVAVVFVAQVFNVEMSFIEQFFVVIAALLTSVGVAGIPSASMVAILVILKGANIPDADLAVGGLLAVDRLLDMSRTAVNVFGDSCAAVVVAKSEGETVLEKR